MYVVQTALLPPTITILTAISSWTWKDHPLVSNLEHTLPSCVMLNSYSAQTVDELTLVSQDSALYFAYFYVTIGDTASQDPRNILGSLVAQLSGYEPWILEDIRQLYNSVAQNQTHRQPIEISALENAVVKIASGTKPVFLLVDAINESSELALVEPLLLRLADLTPNLRILVTTTAVSTSALPEYAKTLNVSAGMMRNDIDTYIQHRFKQDETLKSLPLKLKAEIERTLLHKADGSCVQNASSCDPVI